MMPDFQSKLESFQLVGENVQLLKEAGRLLTPELNAVLVTFYDRALADPNANKFFDSSKRVESARNAQKKHWEMLLAGDLGAAYLASTDRIGRTHARINLPLETYLSSYACASSHLIEILLVKMAKEFNRRNSTRATKIVSVVTRAFALDIERVVDTTFAVWGEEQRIAFDGLNHAIDALAEGNLAHVIPGPDESDYPTRYDPVRVKFNMATARLGSLVGNMATSMDTLLQVIGEVDASAEELSQRTASQAASLEETAAAMEELTESVSSTAANTAAANAITQDARGEVLEGAKVVGSAAEAMQKIEKSSDEISQITKLIDDIAFQTNILAFNAGVEAARAGDAGRGFAVVASEVRTLATKSSVAANAIKDLIGLSTRNVGEGVERMRKAESLLAVIVTSFDRVTDLAGGVAIASREQSQALSEVNGAISHLDTITQMNASMVSDTTSSTKLMSDKAMALKSLLSSLRYAPEEARYRPARTELRSSLRIA